jgi:hypothetical protein
MNLVMSFHYVIYIIENVSHAHYYNVYVNPNLNFKKGSLKMLIAFVRILGSPRQAHPRNKIKTSM